MKISITTALFTLIAAFNAVQLDAINEQDSLTQMEQVAAQPSINSISWSLNIFHDENYNEELWQQLTHATRSFIKDTETLEWSDSAFQTSFGNFINVLTETSDSSLHGSCTINLGAEQDKNTPMESSVTSEQTFPSEAIVVSFIMQRSEDASKWQSIVDALTLFVNSAQPVKQDNEMKRLSAELGKSLFAQLDYNDHLNVNIIPAA